MKLAMPTGRYRYGRAANSPPDSSVAHIIKTSQEDHGRGWAFTLCKLGMRVPLKEARSRLGADSVLCAPCRLTAVRQEQGRNRLKRLYRGASDHRLLVSAALRLWLSLDRKPGGCWTLIGSRLRPPNYGLGRSTTSLGRAAWTLFRGGPPPPELYVLHTCDNRSCGRPDHLYLGTHQMNMADMSERGLSTRDRRLPSGVNYVRGIYTAMFTDCHKCFPLGGFRRAEHAGAVVAYAKGERSRMVRAGVQPEERYAFYLANREEWITSFGGHFKRLTSDRSDIAGRAPQ